MQSLFSVLLIVLALPVLAQAQLCYRYLSLDFPTPTGETGQTSLLAITPDDFYMVGNYTHQDPPTWFLLRPRQEGTKFIVEPFPARPEGVAAPSAINHARDRAGSIRLAPGRHAGFLLKADGTFRIVEVPFATFTGIGGINNKRDLVGSYGTADGKTHGLWVWKGQFLTRDHPQATGLTQLEGINFHQRIAGWYCDDVACHGMDLTAGIYTTLDAPTFHDTFLYALNDAGHSVGYAAPAEAFGVAVLYKDGTWYNAHPPFANVIRSEATGINNQGRIIGNYVTENAVGEQANLGFLAIPQDPCTSTSTVLPVLGP